VSAAATDTPAAAGTTPPSLAVVVVNWNGRDHLPECIGSLLADGYDPLRIVVVDNASGDDSVRFCRDAFPSVELVISDRNRYWAGGNNLGLRHLLATGGADFTLLLNNDTVVPQGSLARLVAAADREPRAWAATPRICFADEPWRIWYDGGRVGRFTGWVGHQGIRQAAGRRPLEERFVEYGTGCALLLARRALAAVPELDEAYTFYGEDTDFCLRLRAAGGRILHVPRSLILHKVSASVGAWSPRKAYLRSRSHVRLLRRHWRGAARAVLVPCQAAYFAGHAVWHLWQGRPAVASAVLMGALDELAGRPAEPPVAPRV